jgi:polysaccharide biosynthesis/export protein
LESPSVSIQLMRSAAAEQINGVYPVQPDGTVNLRTCGMVYVAGKTVGEAREAVQACLSQYFDSPIVGVEVLQFNSQSYYVILPIGWNLPQTTMYLNRQDLLYGQVITYENGAEVSRSPLTELSRTAWTQIGEWTSTRFAITGNETVLDVVSKLWSSEQQRMSRTQVWIARPTPNGNGPEQILPVDLLAIARGGRTDTNYQIMPGDRVYITYDEGTGISLLISKVVSPIERLLGVTVRGVAEARDAQAQGRAYNAIGIARGQ